LSFAATAILRIRIFEPSARTAAAIALRSAQTVIEYDTFSTLHPKKICPDSVSTAAPT
jgi:hypothetical protein